MRCVNCGHNMNRNDKICTSCGVDARLIRQLSKMSYKYYNKGLAQAKGSNLSGAIESLKLSVGFNKRNMLALNLMGLIYMEIGEPAEAFKYWFKSADYRKKNNPALAYINHFQEHMGEVDKMDIGVKIYNEVLAKMRNFSLSGQDPEKIKKRLEYFVSKLSGVLDMNPRLLKAANLLTLCFILLGERARALEITKSVLYTDITNREATRYYNALCPERTRPPLKITGDTETKQPEAKAVKKPGLFSTAMLMEVCAFLLGVFVCVAVFWFLIIPGMEEGGFSLNFLNRQEVSETAEVEEQTTENDTRQAQPTAEEISAKEAAIARAQTLYQNYFYIDACGLIYDMDLTGVSAQSLNIYDSIIDGVVLNASKALLELGQKSYNEGDLTSADSFLNRGLGYLQNATEDETELFETKYTILFYLGRSAMDQGKTDEAKRLFTEVNNNHPDKKYKEYAEGYLNSLMEV